MEENGEEISLHEMDQVLLIVVVLYFNLHRRHRLQRRLLELQRRPSKCMARRRISSYTLRVFGEYQMKKRKKKEILSPINSCLFFFTSKTNGNLSHAQPFFTSRLDCSRGQRTTVPIRRDRPLQAACFYVAPRSQSAWSCSCYSTGRLGLL